MLGKFIAATVAAALVIGCQGRVEEPSPAGASVGMPAAAGSDTGAYSGGRDDVSKVPAGVGTTAISTAAGTGAASPRGVAGSGATSTRPDAGSGASSRRGTAGTGAIWPPTLFAGSAGSPRASDPEDSGIPDTMVTVVATMSLAQPSDLQFNPYVPDELWVVNHADSSAAIITNASTPSRSVQRRIDPEGAQHFMPSPMGLAFGGRETSIVDAQGKMVEGTFATCPENSADGMGPTLWASDLRIFGLAKDVREPPFNGPDTGEEGPSSHIDMLHRTPTCIGIDWEGTGNIYWTYSASKAMFVRYDFAKDHGIGNSYHSDASIWRYPVEGIGYTRGVPSHMVYEPKAKRLYMSDTEHGRVVMFDPASATDSSPMSDGENLDHLRIALDIKGGQVTELIGSEAGLKRPSGLEIHAGNLYVSDNATSTIYKFTLAGAPLGQISIANVTAGALAGIAFGPDDKLYFVDMVGSRVLRLENAF